MLSQLRPAVVLIVAFTLLTGVAFPLAFTGFASVAMPFQAGGSMVTGADGAVVGSALIGQNWTKDIYFHGRPSSLSGTAPDANTPAPATPYDASESGASNLAPTSQALIDRVTADVKTAGGGPVPGDSVTTSASGLDPDISPATAFAQVAGVAKARGIEEAKVHDLVLSQIHGKLLGLFGAAHVNVLALNMALDKLGK
jgi:K+-transporting ATPase ATPase C chain